MSRKILIVKDINMSRNSISPENRKGSSKFKNDVFFKNLQTRRIEQNLTQEIMALKLNMQTPNYSRLEGGAFPKDPRRIVEIARILKVDLNWLFGFNDDVKP